MVQLTFDNVVSTFSSSKGNQIKCHKDNTWYKLDDLGYEALAEYIVSKSLLDSGIDHVVPYTIEPVSFNGKEPIASVSKDFTQGASVVTASRLFKLKTGDSIDTIVVGDTLTKMEIFLKKCSEFTGLPLTSIQRYISTLLNIDFIFLNDDRHYNNIAFLYKDKKFYLAPIFDNGGCLMSALDYYPIVTDVEHAVDYVRSKPFCTDSYVQRDLINSIYDTHLQISPIQHIQYACYSSEINSRVNDIIDYINKWRL